MVSEWPQEINPVLEKRYFIAVTPEGRNPGFKRHAFRLLESKNKVTLVHYLGDESIGSQHPHGNSKSNTNKLYVRTCPSVLHTASKLKDCPSNVYKRIITDTNVLQASNQFSCHGILSKFQIFRLEKGRRLAFPMMHYLIYMK